MSGPDSNTALFDLNKNEPDPSTTDLIKVRFNPIQM